MPSNIRQLKKDIRKDLESKGKDIQKLAAQLLLERVADNVRIDSGRLSGGTVVTQGRAPQGEMSIILNKSRAPSYRALAMLNLITGKEPVFVSNTVPYAIHVERRYKFWKMSIMEAAQALRSQGYKVTVTE